MLQTAQRRTVILPEREGAFFVVFLQGKKVAMQKRDFVTFDRGAGQCPSCEIWRRNVSFPKKSLAFPEKGCYTASRQFNNGSC